MKNPNPKRPTEVSFYSSKEFLNKKRDFKGEELSVIEASKKFNIKESNLSRRMRIEGMSLEEAVEVGNFRSRTKIEYHGEIHSLASIARGEALDRNKLKKYFEKIGCIYKAVASIKEEGPYKKYKVKKEMLTMEEICTKYGVSKSSVFRGVRGNNLDVFIKKILQRRAPGTPYEKEKIRQLKGYKKDYYKKFKRKATGKNLSLIKFFCKYIDPDDLEVFQKCIKHFGESKARYRIVRGKKTPWEIIKEIVGEEKNASEQEIPSDTKNNQ